MLFHTLLTEDWIDKHTSYDAQRCSEESTASGPSHIDRSGGGARETDGRALQVIVLQTQI